MTNKLFYALIWVAVKLGFFKGDWTDGENLPKK